MNAVVEMAFEGASRWSWATCRTLAKLFRLTVSANLTPTTDLLLTPGFARTLAGEERSRHELEAKITEWRQDMLSWTRQCPAQHPVVPYELRVTMPRASRKRWIETFPNAEAGVTYIPVPFYFCPVCQSVYRLREVEVIDHSTNEERQRA